MLEYISRHLGRIKDNKHDLRLVITHDKNTMDYIISHLYKDDRKYKINNEVVLIITKNNVSNRWIRSQFEEILGSKHDSVIFSFNGFYHDAFSDNNIDKYVEDVYMRDYNGRLSFNYNTCSGCFLITCNDNKDGMTMMTERLLTRYRKNHIFKLSDRTFIVFDKDRLVDDLANDINQSYAKQFIIFRLSTRFSGRWDKKLWEWFMLHHYNISQFTQTVEKQNDL